MKVIIKIFLFISLSFLLFRNIRLYEVVTSSMEPVINTSSITVVHIVRNNYIYKLNDIIIYKIPQFPESITHRIIKITNTHNKEFYITKGDNNKEYDPYPISREEIIGKVILSIPHIMNIYKNLASYKWLFLSFYMPVGLIMGSMFKLNKEV